MTTQLKISPLLQSPSIWRYIRVWDGNGGGLISTLRIPRHGEGSSHGMVFIIQATSAVDRSKWRAVRYGMAQRRGKANFCNWWAVEGSLGWRCRVREFNPPVHQLKPSLPYLLFSVSSLHHAQWIPSYIQKSRSNFFFFSVTYGERESGRKLRLGL